MIFSNRENTGIMTTAATTMVSSMVDTKMAIMTVMVAAKSTDLLSKN
jgi:hypothetical protein